MSWRYFTRDEFECHCGCRKNKIKDELIDLCDALRGHLDVPLIVNSGYRCPDHPIEASKLRVGPHGHGLAADLSMPDGVVLRDAVEILLRWGVKGIGVGKRFVHIDLRQSTPVMWGYGEL